MIKLDFDIDVIGWMRYLNEFAQTAVDIDVRPIADWMQ